MDLRNRVVVVTGASAGIGEAAAIEFARRGAKVVLAARRVERLEDLASRIERAGGKALAVRCDVGDPAQLERLRLVVDQSFGTTDVLVNNAGIPGRTPFSEMPFVEIENIVRVNLLGVLFGTRAFLPAMLERGRGHVVNVASLAGRFATPGAPVYTATKHAVVAFSESMSAATRSRGVLVTSVNPGFVPTERFPQTGRPGIVLLSTQDVAKAIVKVVRNEIAPEYSIPRWVSALQVFRLLTPPLYRWGTERLGGRSTP
jgi:short-subunit dehydrogenase